MAAAGQPPVIPPIVPLLAVPAPSASGQCCANLALSACRKAGFWGGGTGQGKVHSWCLEAHLPAASLCPYTVGQLGVTE